MIIGTAGHIDHGKTALIKALTGQDTDRLKEEKERGISIDLGFAHFDLPGGERVGVVDVPGHERFIKNMLAGAHGIDIVLFTVAADDGVMPQSEEHLDILHFLGVRSAIFVITKIDLVPSAQVQEVEEEIRILSLGTSLEGSPVVAVSALTGQGIDTLNVLIAETVRKKLTVTPSGYFRLPVDRSFILQGLGHVVTGTAWSGEVRMGDRVRILPGGHLMRVRSLQVHNHSVHIATWGQRIALNLVGQEKGEVERGDMVCHEKYTLTTTRSDALLELRPAAGKGVETHDRVRVYIGASERMARLILLEGRRHLEPKNSAACQLVFKEPLFALRGDRFIIRNETAEKTLGGGMILDPFARKHKASEGHILQELQIEPGEKLHELLQSFLERAQGFSHTLDTLFQAVNRREDEVEKLLKESADIITLCSETGEKSYTTRSKWVRLREKILDEIRKFHEDHPLGAGMEMEELRARLPTPLSPRVFREVTEALVLENVVCREESILFLPGHRVRLGSEETLVAKAVLEELKGDLFSPPDVKQLEKGVGEERKIHDVLRVLEREGKVVKVGPDLYFMSEAVNRAKTLLLKNLEQNQEITAAAFRTLLGSTRKYTIALLEYFDRQGFTLRVGDVRRLRAQK
jgi:selenocysteine-specific elongation factor